MRRALLIVPLVALFVVGGTALFRSRPAEIGRPAPDFELPSVREPSEKVSLADLRGKPAVINFWASWCEPCKDEAPKFARSARRFGGDVSFVGINILDGREEAEEYLDEYKLRYRNVSDARGVISKRYGVTGVPETVFLDAEGKIVGKYIGAFTKDLLDKLVQQLIDLPEDGALNISGRGETRPVP